MAQDKLPAFQFYVGDWLKDPAVRAVSLTARGLWIDMLCLMHESPRRGYLQHATGKPVTAEQLARMTGCSTDEVSRLLQELDDAGVFSWSEHGVIYSRRMVRDEQKRLKCQEAGRRGGNPILRRCHDDATLKGQSKGGAKGAAKGAANRNPTPSSSSSFSSSYINPPNPPSLQQAVLDALAAVGQEWVCVCVDVVDWFGYLRDHGKPVRQPAQRTAHLCRLFGSPSKLRAAIATARANGWVTLKPDMAATSKGATVNPFED